MLFTDLSGDTYSCLLNKRINNFSLKLKKKKKKKSPSTVLRLGKFVRATIETSEKSGRFQRKPYTPRRTFATLPEDRGLVPRT